MEKILATNKNAEAIAEKIKGFTVLNRDKSDGKTAFVKEVLIAIDAYGRAYDAKKLRPVLHAEAFTGVRRALEKVEEGFKANGSDKVEPDETLIKIIIETIGDDPWRERVGSPIYKRGAFSGFMLAVAAFRKHVDEALESMDTAGK